MAYGFKLLTTNGLEEVTDITNGQLLFSYNVVNNNGFALDTTQSFSVLTNTPYPVREQENESRFVFITANDRLHVPIPLVEEDPLGSGNIKVSWEWEGYNGSYAGICSLNFDIFYVRFFQQPNLNTGVLDNYPFFQIKGIADITTSGNILVKGNLYIPNYSLTIGF